MLSHLKDAFPDSLENNYANDSNVSIEFLLCARRFYTFTGHKWYNSQNSPVRKVLSLSPFYRKEKKKKKEQGSHKANKWQELFSESVFAQFALITVFNNIIIWLISLLCPDYSPQFYFDFVLA